MASIVFDVSLFCTHGYGTLGVTDRMNGDSQIDKVINVTNADALVLILKSRRLEIS